MRRPSEDGGRNYSRNKHKDEVRGILQDDCLLRKCVLKTLLWRLSKNIGVVLV